MAEKLILEVSRARSIPLATFLYALGIPDVGKSVAETLATAFGDLASARHADVHQLMALPKIGPIVARRYVEGMEARAALIDDLVARVDVEPYEVPTTNESPTVAGVSVLVTGTRVAMKRRAQSMVKSLGGTAASGVSKSLTYLVVGDAGSAGSKLAKAEAAGVKVLTETEFLQLLNDARDLG